MTRFRLAIITAAFTLLIAVAGLNWYTSLHRGANGGLSQGGSEAIPGAPQIGGPFTLTDQDGQTVTEAALKGHWTAVFFGYTYCPDICPLTLQSLARTQTLLGDKAKDLKIVFITVDPARDTPANLKAYLASHGFPQGVTGLTGTQAQIDAVTKAYANTPTRVEGTDGAYTFNHTGVIYLMNPQGQFDSPLTEDMGPDKNADLIKQAMRGA